MPEKPDLEMTAGMVYDPTGAAQAKADVTDTAATAESAAASSEQASQKAANAADKDAEKQKQLAQMMRLTMMTRKELREEILRLIAAQKAAAQANNSEAYEELTASINRAKEALEKLNTAQQVGMIAMQQQAQTGMQFAQGLGSLGQSAQQGAAGLATAATQAIALGMAIKAGLGPIGWVMAALQGLGMVVTYFTEKSKKEEEAVKATTKALQEQKKALDDLAVAEERNAAGQALADADDKAAAIRKAGEKEQGELRDKHEKARLEREKGLLDKRKANEAERKAEAEAVRTGKMSPEEAAARERERNAKTAEAEKTAEAQAAAEEKALLEKEKVLAPKLLDARRAALRDVRGSMNEQDLAVVSVEDKALRELVQRADEAKAREKEWSQKVDEAQAAWEDDKTDDNEKKWRAAEKVRTEARLQRQQLEEELLNRTREQVDVLKANGQLQAKTKVGRAKEAVQIISGINAAQKGVEEQEAANKELDEKLGLLEQQLALLEQEKTELTTAADEAGKEAKAAAEGARLEEEWKEVQKKAAPERIAFLRDALGMLEEGTALHRQYNEMFKQEVAAAQTTARQEEWQRVQREKSLADQATWLRATAGHLEAGSEEAKKWAEQLQGVETRRLQEALGNLEKEFKVTGNYVAEDKRTQRQILLDDKAALQGRAARLQSLIAETKDYALRRQLQEKLDETVKQQKALEAATDANAKACRAMLKGYKAPDFHDGNKMVQRNLKQLGHAYERNIKLAEKAAEKGDTKAQERYTRLAGKYAERISRKRKDFAGEHEKNLDALKAAQKKQTKEEEQSAKDAKKNRNRQDKQDPKKKPQQAKLDRKESDTNFLSRRSMRAPRDAKTEAPRREPGEAGQELADTKAALKSTQDALSDMSAKVSDLAATAAAIATAAAQISKAAGNNLKNLKKQLKTMQTDIQNLWKEVDA